MKLAAPWTRSSPRAAVALTDAGPPAVWNPPNGDTLITMESGLSRSYGRFGEEAVTPVQPYQARKAYVCPGCGAAIDVGVGHLVVVPIHDPDLRRHWHRGCWFKEQRRRGSADAG